MSQIDALVTNVAELLTAAVQEVLHIMGHAVSEYQKEAARTRVENQNLQMKLKELQERMAVVSDEFTQHEPHPGENHETLIYHGKSIVEEKSWSERISFTGQNHVHLTPTEDPHHSLLGTCNDSLNQQRPSSQSQSSPIKILNPSSPDIGEEPITSNSVKPVSITSSRIKVESKPEPLACSVSETDNVTTDVFSIPEGPLVNGHSQQPVSTNVFSYDQIHSLPNSTFVISEHILRSRVENTVDVNNGPTISGWRENSHSCHVCGKTFASSSSLGAHFVCHSNERPFVCKCCNFRFSRLADLKKHERIHTGERPHKCSLCGRRFNRTENLKRHLRKIHNGAVISQAVNSVMD
ncbi:zinc finger protein with KRAB and SCAN domains 1 [Triplophysa dalaica]|uniref:zinc finger protein with KRAB and SCAN domains 1 n=1 Tax=Triplophysa dalaica TaxID=1582913 RepID=UPI0024DF6721|nr:zinc finger protein with KRAB and SCAN domains 1 [Triplophysa dalaica]XP_056609549.1 zinc finger protein with KRAB and SCAN domains 1 [Triplophysa dalaica]